MRRKYRGFCPPFIAIGLLLLAMVASFALLLQGDLMVTAKADTTIPGSEVAPPGGQWPSGETTEPSGSQNGDAGGTTVVVPTDPPVVEPTEPPVTTDHAGDGEAPTFPVDPGAEETPTEPVIAEDPVGRYPSRLDTQGIKIVSPSLDDLLADGANLESLLYPSGLQLPTKYMDLLMMAPTNSSSTVAGETANFLKTIAPTPNSTYTFAEYTAADVYLAICRVYSMEPGTTDTADALQSLDVNTTVNWMKNITNATLSDSSKLVSLLGQYKSILESFGGGGSIVTHKQYKDITSEHKDVYYSLGSLSRYSSFADGSAQNDSGLSTYTLSLYSTWDYLGVTQVLTGNILEYSKFYNEFAFNGVNYNRGAPANSYTPNEEAPDTTAPVPNGEGESSGGNTTVVTPNNPNPGGNTVVEGSTGQEWVNGSTEGSGDTPVANVGGGSPIDTSVLPTGRKNIEDIASIVAIAVAVVGVAIVWGIHTHRKGHDPLSRWK